MPNGDKKASSPLREKDVADGILELLLTTDEIEANEKVKKITCLPHLNDTFQLHPELYTQSHKMDLISDEEDGDWWLAHILRCVMRPLLACIA